MTRPVPARDSAPGFSLLLRVDPHSGRFDGSHTLFVPVELAETLNAARRELFDKREHSTAWARACVRPTSPVPTTPPADDGDDVVDPQPHESAARLRAIRDSMQQPRPAGAPATPTPAAPPAAPRRRAGAGQTVQVISAASITERRKGVELRTKFTSEEKKTEIKVMDELLARGETRLVGLTKDWRPRIAALRADMPHLAQVIARIEACCALSSWTRQPLRIPPLLLVGPPGVGKTHFAKCLADLLGVPQFVYALESAETVSVLTGSDKHWWNSEPGQLFKLIVQGEFANPVVILDELDKVTTGGNHYRPANALHTVLEPSTARQLRDKCIDLSFDASYVVYVATSNRLSSIDAALLSRFELFHVDEPGPRAAVALARAIGQQVLQHLNLTRRFERPTGEVVQQLALLGSPRRMHKVLTAAVGRAVVGGRTRVVVTDLLDDTQKSSQEHGPRSERDPVH